MCGISLACSGGAAFGSGAAPRAEWERKEWREEPSRGPTWTAGKDAAFWGLGCPPSAHKGEGINKRADTKRGGRMGLSKQ